MLLALLVANLRRSRTGRRLIAVRTNERAAASLGISVFGVKLYAFAVSAGLAAVAGILVGFRGQVITYTEFNLFASINSLGQRRDRRPRLRARRGVRRAERDRRHRHPRHRGLDPPREPVGPHHRFAHRLRDPHRAPERHRRRRRRTTAGCGRSSTSSPGAASAQPLPPAEVEPVAGATLSITGLTVRFGSVVAVDDVSMEVRPGEVVGLIGPNGAGKTTLIDAVTGFVPVSGGSIAARRSPHRPAERDASGPGSGCGARSSRSSCSRTSASRRTSGPGSDQRASRLSWVTDLFWPGHHDLPPTAVAAVREFELEPHLDQTPEELPYGRRRLVGIARTVASGPSVVMLDEPAAGLDENESAELARLIRRLADERNMGVLLVEHDVEPRDVDLRSRRGDRLRPA